MSAPELRNYQRAVIDRIYAEIAAGRRRILVPLPTGGGKTVVVADIIANEVRQGRRVLFLAHRRELIDQASRKQHAVGVDAGIILPGYPMRLAEPVQVASIASLRSRAISSSSIEMPIAEIVVVDEAHHARARTYRRILEEYPRAIVIGLTATPCRGDGRGLGNVFDVLVECPEVGELTEAGWLVRAKIYAPTRPDLAGIRIRQGDYHEGQLAERMDRPQLVGDIVEHWHRHAERRPTIVYATSVAHSVHLRDEFRRAGVLAEHIDGNTPTEERDAILARLARGEVEVVCNCMVLTEGFDAPDVGCLVLARPTKSLGLFRQMVGRGLRSAPGKSDCVILDHAGAVFTHGFPDDPIEWILHEDRRAENKTHAARGAYGGPPQLTDCPECHAVRFEGRPCTICGWQPRPKPAAVDIVDGDLGRIERDRSIAAPGIDQQRYYRQLLGLARQRGYSDGFAYHKYREKFGGAKPPWSWKSLPPEAPGPDVVAWVRSRQVAYAKSQAKQRAAS